MVKTRNPDATKHNDSDASARIDKWLWAARFFKTRSLASEAIKSGKVMVNGAKIKPSREIKIGEEVTIRQSIFTKTVVVKVLSLRRGPATLAATYYEETSQSSANRQRLLEIQQAQPAIRQSGLGRPTKRERRQIISFTTRNKR